MNSSLMCLQCQDYLLNDPMQCDCGDRLCGRCFKSFKERHQKTFICPQCGEENIVDNCFRDKAVEYELRNSTLKCLNPSCPWEGESRFYQEHFNTCKFGVVPCPNSSYGCKEEHVRSKVHEHVKTNCHFNPVTCQWCGRHTVNQELHLQKECDQVPEFCPNGCGERLPRREMLKHTKTVCTHQIRECDYKDLGCQYKGTIKDLTKHAKKYTAYHNQLLKAGKKEMQQSLDQRNAFMEKEMYNLRAEISRIRSEVNAQIQPTVDAVARAEMFIQQLQSGFSEMSLVVQTLQAATYDNTFVRPIPNSGNSTVTSPTGYAQIHLQTSQPSLAVRNDPIRSRLVGCSDLPILRRASEDDIFKKSIQTVTSFVLAGAIQLALQLTQQRPDCIIQAKEGYTWKIDAVTRKQDIQYQKREPLYSDPFYTSWPGYKVCLRLYMNGDGSGKGTHLSFFITLMRGEYDALLPWPFKQAVTLTLVDQNKQRDIIQSFRPEPTSSSFQRPRNEMNIASGCPMFAPVSVLDNSSYVKDDTMFLKCKINTTGLPKE